MLRLAALVATLLRIRVRGCVVLACLTAMLCATHTASALDGVQPKTRVWGFEFAQPPNVWLERAASPRTHPGNHSCRPELASAS